MAVTMTGRRKLTTLDKLHIVARQARCPVCGEKLGPLDGLDWDHEQALGRGGTDTIDNVRAIHRDCHAHKTAKMDIPEIAKTKRLTRKNEEAVARMLAKAPGQERPRSRWASRPMRRAGERRMP